MDELYQDEMLDEAMDVAKDAGKTAKRFLNSLGKQRLRLLIVLLSVTVYSVLNICAPLYSGAQMFSTL